MVAGGIHSSIKGRSKMIGISSTRWLTTISFYRQVFPCRVRLFICSVVPCTDDYLPRRHMGVSVVDPGRGDIEKVSKALVETLREARASKA